MLWVGIGAIGGVIAYRRGQRAVADARERGLVGNVQHAALTASHVADTTSKVLAFVGQVGHSGWTPQRIALENDAARWRELQASAVTVQAVRRSPELAAGAAADSSPSAQTSSGDPVAVRAVPDAVDLRTGRRLGLPS